MEDLGQGREEGGKDGGCPKAKCAKDGVSHPECMGARSFQMLGNRAGTLARGAWSPRAVEGERLCLWCRYLHPRVTEAALREGLLHIGT